MRKWCKHPDDDSHCTAKPKFRPRTGLPKTKTAKSAHVQKRTSESTVYSVRHSARCFQSFCDSYIMVWILCWPVHCCSTPAKRSLKNASLTWIICFRRTFSMLDFRLKQHLPFFDFFDRRRKRLWLGLLITISVSKCLRKNKHPSWFSWIFFSTSQPSNILQNTWLT